MNLRKGLGNLVRLGVRLETILLVMPLLLLSREAPRESKEVGCTSRNSVLGKTGNLPVDCGGLWERGPGKMKTELAGGPGHRKAQLRTAGSEPSQNCRGATEKNLRLSLQFDRGVTMNILNFLNHSFLLVDGDNHSTRHIEFLRELKKITCLKVWCCSDI